MVANSTKNDILALNFLICKLLSHIFKKELYFVTNFNNASITFS